MNRLSYLSGQYDEEQKLQQQIIELDNWFKSPRYNNVQRPYTAKQVAEVRGSIVPNQFSDFMARKFYNLMMDLKKSKGFSLACGALDTVQVTDNQIIYIFQLLQYIYQQIKMKKFEILYK